MPNLRRMSASPPYKSPHRHMAGKSCARPSMDNISSKRFLSSLEGTMKMRSLCSW